MSTFKFVDRLLNWLMHSSVTRIGKLVFFNTVLVFGYTDSRAQSPLSISSAGAPNYRFTVQVPPGIAGMSPNIGLLYNGSAVNGAVGYGWTIQ